MSDSWIDKVLASLFAIIIFVLTFMLGVSGAGKAVRDEAVKHGAAEYVADKEGNVEFKWKTPSSNQP